ncbi:hypothetical protein VST7929_01734 [Vibrio stylophorae]|uniref:VOC domain-containing protein n=1 Tax=Vibrio stylophorae TaxID=659351 RepID=A0ABM8ZU56_9VIBR|nr:VOC family protein [Vibrio stylophorae]CAH0533858.1 hypothetical protein VST7929_01734 [Vibrio stylophorae]
MSSAMSDAVAVPVYDHSRSLIFYRDLLGFELRHDRQSKSERIIALAPKGSQRHIELVSPCAGLQPGSTQGLLVPTSDIEGMHQRLASGGVEISPIQEVEHGRFATFTDPDGNAWALVESYVVMRA